MSRSTVLAATIAAALVLVCIVSTEAGTHRRHRAATRAAPQAYAAAPGTPYMYYPQDIAGGVSGNLPFNNQIRKHTDPLNANGGR